MFGVHVIRYGLPTTVSPAVLEHDALPEIVTLPAFSPAMKPLYAQVSVGSDAPYVLPLATALTDRTALAIVNAAVVPVTKL